MLHENYARHQHQLSIFLRQALRNLGEKIPMLLKYGILDDEGIVIRWVWVEPPYPHVVVKVKRQRPPKIDLSNLPDALF